VKFGLETAGTTEILSARAATPTSAAPSRFFDTALTGVAAAANAYASSGMTSEQITYVGMSNTALASSVGELLATFNGHSKAVAPSGFTPVSEVDFQVYINGVMIPVENRTTDNSGSNITVTFNDLGFTLDSTDQVVLVGKFS
jgi:hypothetical protein